MNRLFLRFLMPVFLSIAIASILVLVVITWIFGDPIEQDAARQASPQIFLLEQYIDKAPADEWLQRLNRVREVSQVKFELISLDQAQRQLSSNQQQALRRGEVIIDVPGKSFYRRVDISGSRYVGSEEDVLQAQDLPIDYWIHVKMEMVRATIVALLLLIPIAFWSRSHWRDVQALAKVTQEFGAGRHSVRATTANSSSIFPLAIQINQMAERIEQLLQSQKNLLHSVSHELRTPIARLEFALEILQESQHSSATNGSDVDTKNHQRILAMRGDLGELNSLVTELLNMAKLDQSNALQLVEIDVEKFIQHCLQLIPPMTDKMALTTEVDIVDKNIIGDERLLTRAVVNLLKNAVKYANSAIHFHFKQTPQNGWTITVEDDGDGIPENEREKIFEAFYRLDRSRDRATGGFGFGLSIVKQIVLLHGASVQVSQSKLGGAKFEIHLAPSTI